MIGKTKYNYLLKYFINNSFFISSLINNILIYYFKFNYTLKPKFNI